MKCSQCGAEFEGKFCPECGNPAKENSNVESAYTQPKVEEQTNSPAEKAKKPFYKRWWFIVLCIIVVLGLFGKIAGNKSDSDDKYEEFKWSSFSLHDKLPEPKSKIGKYVFDNSDSLSVTVAETEKSDYKDYVEKCETEFGFSIDKLKTDTSFTASNNDKYTLTVIFNDSENEMSISLIAKIEDDKDDISSTEKTTETEKKQEETSTKETEKEDDGLVNGMHKDFKEAMDSYEAFYDSYIDFMKSYDSGDLTMLAKYTEFLSNTAEMDKKFAKWESEDLNDKETAYYLEVQTRVNKKLLDVVS